MGKAMFLASNFAFIVIYSLIANLLNRPNNTLDFPTSITNPNATNFLQQIVAPLVWVFQSLGTLFGMIGFAFVGVDPLVFLIAIGPLFVIDLVLIVGMIRGGGT